MRTIAKIFIPFAESLSSLEAKFPSSSNSSLSRLLVIDEEVVEVVESVPDEIS
jgi:hypothetical protein